MTTNHNIAMTLTSTYISSVVTDEENPGPATLRLRQGETVYQYTAAPSEEDGVVVYMFVIEGNDLFTAGFVEGAAEYEVLTDDDQRRLAGTASITRGAA